MSAEKWVSRELVEKRLAEWEEEKRTNRLGYADIADRTIEVLRDLLSQSAASQGSAKENK